MTISSNLAEFSKELSNFSLTLVAVSKTYPNESILEAYSAGQRHFGENKVQELCAKYESLPKDINWHLIGHLQSNKVKYCAPFVYLIHSVDSVKLLLEINKEGKKNNRKIQVLLQIHIADEETKFGFSLEEIQTLLSSEVLDSLTHVAIIGFMGMATNTSDESKVQQEFKLLHTFYDSCKPQFFKKKMVFTELSMGMSSDYRLALKEGSTMVRIGSSLFGKRS